MENKNLADLDASLWWEHYFPFATGERVFAQLSGRKFFLNFSANGSVEVKENTPKTLSFELNIPQQRIAGLVNVPASLLSVTIEFKQRGPGNSARISGNIGTNPVDITDDDLSILSYPKTKRRRIDPSLDVEAGDLRFDLVQTLRSGVSAAEIRDIQGVDLLPNTVVKIWRNI